MDDELKRELAEIKAIATRAAISAEKTRRYFMWTLIITVVMMVLPLIGLAFVIPFYLSQLKIFSGIGF